MRIFGSILATRARVFGAALGTGGALASTFFLAVPWIEHHSTSVGTNLILIVFTMLLSILTGFLLALFLGDTIFGADWRGHVFDTVEIGGGIKETDLYELSRTMRARTFQFSALVVFCSAVILGGGNALMGDFFGRYQKVGYHTALFRGDNTKLKLSAMKQISVQYGPDMEERTKLMVPLLDSRNPRVRRGAVNAFAKITKQVARGVTVLALSGDEYRTRWEFHLLREIREKVVPQLLAAVEKFDDESFRLGAWMAIGSALPEKLYGFAEERAGQISYDSAERMVLNVVMGRIALLEFTPFLMEEMDSSRPERTRIAAIWAMGRILDKYEDPGLHRKKIDEQVEKSIETLAKIAEGGTLGLRCAAFEALLCARDARQVLMLFRALEEAPREQRCPSHSFKLPDAVPISFVRETNLRFKS